MDPHLIEQKAYLNGGHAVEAVAVVAAPAVAAAHRAAAGLAGVADWGEVGLVMG
jgi:hypothetical protein